MTSVHPLNPDDFIITKKRKQYKFAWFANLENCFEADEWQASPGPTILEIGAGDGRFALELARQHPDTQIVAVDVKADRLYTSARLATEQSIKNIVFVRAHAEKLPTLLRRAQVRDIWLTFSDPYPKARQAKHRLTHPRFLQVYRQLLDGHGRLKMKTDNLELFQWSLEQLVSEQWRLSRITFDLHASDFADEWKFQTAYERRFMAQGITIKALEASIAQDEAGE